MSGLNALWGPGIAGPLLIVQCALFLSAAVSLLNSARRLHRFGSRGSILGATSGETLPDELANAAITGHLPPISVLRETDSPVLPHESPIARSVISALPRAETRFRYMRDLCQLTVDMSRRVSVLIFVTSLVIAAYSAFPLYLLSFNNSKYDWSWHIFWTMKDLLTLLGHGWSLCAILYSVSIPVERALNRRRIQWEYFCMTAKCEQGGGC